MVHQDREVILVTEDHQDSLALLDSRGQMEMWEHKDQLVLRDKKELPDHKAHLVGLDLLVHLVQLDNRVQKDRLEMLETRDHLDNQVGCSAVST